MTKPLSSEWWFRRAFVRAFERIPVADRGWNERVATALWADERFRDDMRVWATRAEDNVP